MDNDNLSNTANAGENSDTGAEKPSDTLKMFSQTEVNKMISHRLNEEKNKMMAEVEKQKVELEHKEFLLNARNQLIAAGHPEKLIDIVNTSSHTAFENSLNALNEYVKEIRVAVSNDFVRGKGNITLGSISNHSTDVRQAMGLE